MRVRLSELRLRRPRQWGACWLALQLWRELQLDRFWGERLAPSRKGTRWDQVLLVLVAYRLIAPGSEWRLHREWFGRSRAGRSAGRGLRPGRDAQALCLSRSAAGAQAGAVRSSGGALARSVQRQLRRAALRSDQHLFRGDPPPDENDKRRFGYSRDKRSDCVQVVIALIVTPEGFPLAYEVLAGNTADKTTLREFLRKIEPQYGKASASG